MCAPRYQGPPPQPWCNFSTEFVRAVCESPYLHNRSLQMGRPPRHSPKGRAGRPFKANILLETSLIGSYTMLFMLDAAAVGTACTKCGLYVCVESREASV